MISMESELNMNMSILLLMEEIRLNKVEGVSLSRYFHGVWHPRWSRRTGRFTDLNSPKQRSMELRLGRKDFSWIDHWDFFFKMQGCFQVIFSKDFFWRINSTVIEKYMAQCLHTGVCWPFTNLPFGIRAIIFDLKVLRTALSKCVFDVHLFTCR